MRVAIIGANGQLGADLLEAYADETALALGRQELELEDATAIERMFAALAPDLVVNTAAFHHLDRCEADPRTALAVNALAPLELARHCARAGIPFAHVSTDYVFDGTTKTPYIETATPNPLNVYGISKYAGELFVARATPEHFIFRTSGLYGLKGRSNKGPAFIERMLHGAAEGRPLQVVDDITFSPSYTRHVARGIRRTIERGVYGTYHITNAGQCTWYEFATQIFKEAGLTPDLTPTVYHETPGATPRPKYSALAHASTLAVGLPELPPWQDGIRAYLSERMDVTPI